MIRMVGVYQKSGENSMNNDFFGTKHIMNSLAQEQRVYQDFTIMTWIVIHYIWSGR